MRILKLNNKLEPARRQNGSAKAQISMKGVQEEVLSLSDKRYCSIIETSSVNFELKSEDEQDALIETYQSFLNGLGFQIQIVIKVREIDLDHYLDDLNERSKKESHAVYRSQIESYATFVRGLVSVNRILSRNFYVIVPLELDSRHDFEFAR